MQLKHIDREYEQDLIKLGSIQAKKLLYAIYMDYFNNYLSIATYAEHNDLDLKHADELIRLAKKIFNHGK